ncbi:MAG TPA: M81 family metallopeptidase [Acidimicrobiia bacterium]|nr:M81 family metallopeptidase [Acidimicrobiia bacterium]
MTRPRILVAGMQYELNSFAAGTADLERFRQFRLAEGEEMWSIAGDDELEGALDVADRRDLELVPIVLGFGGAGPVLTDETYHWFRDRILAGVERHVDQLDAIYLPLHGAMASESVDDTEGDLVAAIRVLTGPDVPVAATFDLHGNFTSALADGLDIAVGFKTCPHVDYVETGRAAVELLADTLEGRVHPRLVHRKLRMMTSAEGHDTTRGPMRPLMDAVHGLEGQPGVLSATIQAPQPWMDVPETGWSVIVLADGDEAVPAASSAADDLARRCWEARAAFLVHRTPLGEALDRAAANVAGAGPVVMTDASDAPSAGSHGDSSVVLAALLERPPMTGPVVMTLTDPAATARCHDAGIGTTVDLEVGGAFQPGFFRPIPIRATVARLYDEPYRSTLPPGMLDPGRRAVVEIDGWLTIVLAERQMSTLDTRGYEASGVDPTGTQAVLVKSAGQFRGFYTTMAREIIELDTPGPVNGILTALPFTRIDRPLWPFDPDLDTPW